jgi:hypothetical protein
MDIFEFAFLHAKQESNYVRGKPACERILMAQISYDRQEIPFCRVLLEVCTKQGVQVYEQVQVVVRFLFEARMKNKLSAIVKNTGVEKIKRTSFLVFFGFGEANGSTADEPSLGLYFSVKFNSISIFFIRLSSFGLSILEKTYN